MTDEIRTSIIGFGMSARVFHAPVILTIPEFRITKVVERYREESREHIPGVDVVRETDALRPIPEETETEFLAEKSGRGQR